MNLMNKPEQYDVLVLGSGTAGKLMAWTMAREGKRTAVVERKYVGGSCPNVACLPSKNLIHSAKIAGYFRRQREFGIVADTWGVNMPDVRHRKQRMVDSLVAVHRQKYKESGAELIMGSGRFVGPKTIEI